jgi:hypothetical protein
MTSPSLISHALSPSDTQKMGLAFSKLMAQYNENEMVLKELKMLDENSTVFKLVGPVLLSQVCALCILLATRVVPPRVSQFYSDAWW